MSTDSRTRARSLALTVTEIEQHAAAAGWDAPIGVFALIRTAEALAANPALADDLPPDVVEAAHADPEHLTSIEQDGLPEAAALEDLLAQLAWPETVHGAAIVVERIVVPPEAEAGKPADPAAGVDYLMHHPDRQDVRIAVGVLRTGESWCALRSRANDSGDAVAGTSDAVPGLVEALAATLR